MLEEIGRTRERQRDICDADDTSTQNIVGLRVVISVVLQLCTSC